MLMKASEDSLLGMVLHGYKLDMLLGRGTVTAVYRARARTKEDMLVTFLLLPDTFSSQATWSFRERFWQLAQKIEALHHPHILPLYGYGERHGYCYLLTPERSGETLFARMRQKQRWSPHEALNIVTPLASAMDYLHTQKLTCHFFHPATILLMKGQEHKTHLLQLAGCGLMQMIHQRGVRGEEESLLPGFEHLKSVSGHYLGAPEYLAPEVVKGQEADERSDVYTLGVLLFTLLCGQPPFLGTNYVEVIQQHITAPLPSLQKLEPALPAAIEVIVNRALHRQPALRFQKPQEMVAAYKKTLEERLHQTSRQQAHQALQRVRAITGPTTDELPSPTPLPIPHSEPLRIITQTQQVSQHLTPPFSIVPPVTTMPPISSAPIQTNPLSMEEEQLEEGRPPTITGMLRTIKHHQVKIRALSYAYLPNPSIKQEGEVRRERFPGWLN